jgi:uncharacterized protein YndB with AHSA1/START domain
MEVVETTARSSAPVDAVWKLLSDHRGYASWGPWHEATLEREGTPPPDGLGAIRILRARPLMTMREEIVAYEPPSRLDYALRAGLPLRDYLATVTLVGTDGETAIHWRSQFEPKVPGTGWFYRWFLGRVIKDVAARAARAAERGPTEPASTAG